MKNGKNGADEETRTPDPRITNALLYQLSYIGAKILAALSGISPLCLRGAIHKAIGGAAQAPSDGFFCLFIAYRPLSLALDSVYCELFEYMDNSRSQRCNIMSAESPFIILPGLGNSGPQHWQSWLAGQISPLVRVEHQNWEQPTLADWIDTAAATIAAHPGAILVAHSLSCSLVAHLVARHLVPGVRGALLAAPADIESHTAAPPEVWNFGPIPLQPFPFPTLLVASHTDPLCPMPRAEQFAAAWGAELVDVGDAGHINAAAGFGPWPALLPLLARLQQSSTADA